MALRLKKGDQVVVIAGRDKGERGEVLKVFPERQRVLVDGVNIAKRHTRPSQLDPQGGIIEKPMPIHVSNVMLWDSKEERGTRVRTRIEEDGSKVRVSVRSGVVLEK